MANTVLITGCSSGIGRATAEYFAARGWNVAATARNPASVASWASPNMAALALDVTDASSIAAAIKSTVDRFGTIDVVVNNAGYGLMGPLEGATSEQLERQFRTNVFGVAAVIRHVLPIMRARGDGTIVNISSVGGRLATSFVSAYYASKFAVEGLSESLRFELQLHGIRVKLVEPGSFKTDFLTRSAEWATHPAYEMQVERMKASVPGRLEGAPGPDAVAKVIFKAATDRSGRLRYPVGARLLLTLHALLPDAIWRALISARLSRGPRLASPSAPSFDEQ